ncbi:uncharacterized protein EV422DRAFT_505582 [Fimicolochytrium jonesii]|uniref:uncharacterized protein n=1 Tax=Fimicolochytrium jonesii TaxID=1396493 RepID=UPI0022FEA6D8|nr:uncharacterized protein EV422DRAFT_505582 [Fimicolochytrium jonesii]KAI8822077.1 hypothetical protein EV422DRAFT_505582 [Fimicolochytrium jonesii]
MAAEQASFLKPFLRGPTSEGFTTALEQIAWAGHTMVVRSLFERFGDTTPKKAVVVTLEAAASARREETILVLLKRVGERMQDRDPAVLLGFRRQRGSMVVGGLAIYGRSVDWCMVTFAAIIRRTPQEGTNKSIWAEALERCSLTDCAMTDQTAIIRACDMLCSALGAAERDDTAEYDSVVHCLRGLFASCKEGDNSRWRPSGRLDLLRILLRGVVETNDQSDPRDSWDTTVSDPWGERPIRRGEDGGRRKRCAAALTSHQGKEPMKDPDEILTALLDWDGFRDKSDGGDIVPQWNDRAENFFAECLEQAARENSLPVVRMLRIGTPVPDHTLYSLLAKCEPVTLEVLLDEESRTHSDTDEGHTMPANATYGKDAAAVAAMIKRPRWCHRHETLNNSEYAFWPVFSICSGDDGLRCGHYRTELSNTCSIDPPYDRILLPFSWLGVATSMPDNDRRSKITAAVAALQEYIAENGREVSGGWV